MASHCRCVGLLTCLSLLGKVGKPAHVPLMMAEIRSIAQVRFNFLLVNFPRQEQVTWPRKKPQDEEIRYFQLRGLQSYMQRAQITEGSIIQSTIPGFPLLVLDVSFSQLLRRQTCPGY